MPKYQVSATGTTEYYLEVEAESPEQAREQVQYLSSDNWISDSYTFTVDFVELAN